MDTRTRVLVGVLAGGLALGGCAWDGPTDTASDDSPIAGTVTAVRVANDSGNVHIRAGDQLNVHRVLRYRDDRPGATHHLEGATLVLGACQQRNCSVDYDVVVPAGVSVSGQVESGDVDVAGIVGVSLRTSSGDVTVRDVTGKVEVAAESGDVRVSGVRGAVDVRSASGDVTVRPATPNSVRVNARSGGIDVAVPRGAYAVDTGASSGDIDDQVADDPSAPERIELFAESGDIRLTYA